MSIKKILGLCLALVMMASVALADDVFTGASTGFNDNELKVEVSVADGKITDIKILENQETPDIGGKAMDELKDKILAEQTLAVDAVSGATYSSNGLVKAVAAAVTEAGIDPTTLGYVDPTAPVILPPCMLLQELDQPESGWHLAGYRYFTYPTQGTTCSDKITFAIEEDGMIVHDLMVYGGCTGTAEAFSILCEGQTVDYCVERMLGILCHGSNGSSCPDQAAKALSTAQALINGTLCDGCDAEE